MAKKYDWIQDGYDGLASDATTYFTERLKVVGDDSHVKEDLEAKRTELPEKFELTSDEVNALTLARKIAEFMDDRKAWMMQTRRLVTVNIGNIEHGWFYNDGKASKVGQGDTHELWQRYVDFKSSTNAVVGIVASNGRQAFC